MINIQFFFKKLDFSICISKWAEFFLPFFYRKTRTPKKIMNLKISETNHQVLKEYCDENGLKIYKYLEKLILDNCKKQKDIYGE